MSTEGTQSHDLPTRAWPHQAALVLVAAGAGFAVGGPEAAVASVAGGVVAGLAFAVMARGLASLLFGGERQPGRVVALVSFVLRQALTAALLIALVVVADLPAPWLLAGVTAVPSGLVIAAIRWHAVRGIAPAHGQD